MECKGVQSVIDKFNENEIILAFEILKRKFDIHINLSTYIRVRQAVLSYLRKYIFIDCLFIWKFLIQLNLLTKTTHGASHTYNSINKI